MKAEWHLLGAVRGYSTLAQSPGVTPAERTAMESVGFGQTDDPAFRASLRSHPAAIGRLLPSGRYAVTRCVPGAPDASGRSTLLFGSILFETRDWSRSVAPVLLSVLTDDLLWKSLFTPPETILELDPGRWKPRDFPSTEAMAALDTWLISKGAGKLVAMSDSPHNSTAIASVPRLLPPADRASISWGLRLLSSNAPVELATLNKAAQTRRPVVSPTPDAPLVHPYSRAVASFWQSRGALPAEFINGVASVEEAFSTSVQTALQSPPNMERRPIVGPARAIGAAFVAVAAGGLWYAIRPSPKAVSASTAASPAPAKDMRPAPPLSVESASKDDQDSAIASLLSRWEIRRRAWSREELAAFIHDGLILPSVFEEVHASARPDLPEFLAPEVASGPARAAACVRIAMRADLWLIAAETQVAMDRDMSGFRTSIFRLRDGESVETLIIPLRKLLNTAPSVCDAEVRALLCELEAGIEARWQWSARL